VDERQEEAYIETESERKGLMTRNPHKIKPKVVAMAVIILLVTAAGSTSGEQPPTTTFEGRQEPNSDLLSGTVQGYLRHAALNSADLKAAFEQWQTAAASVPNAKAILDPKLTYGYYIQEVETGRQRVGVSQTFGLFGKKAAAESEAEAKAEAARLKYEEMKFQLFLEVKEAFYEYVYLTKATETTQEHLATLARVEDAADERYSLTAAGVADVTFARMEMAGLENMLEELKHLTAPTAVKLNSFLNRPKDAQLARPEPEEFKPVQLNRTIVVDMLRQKNPELAKLDKEIEAAMDKGKLARAQFYPDIGVGIDFIRTEQTITSGIRPDEKDLMFLMLSMSVPLGRDSYKAAQLQTKMDIQKKEQERMEAENNMLARAIQAMYDYEDSSSHIRLYKNGLLAKSENLLKTLEKKYYAGTRNLADLINTGRVSLSYRLGYEKALAINRQKLAELEMLTGTKLD
jgi:outer membrane protein TolC